MPMHDWTRVSAGAFHDFHGSWIAELKKSLNRGLLPAGATAVASAPPVVAHVSELAEIDAYALKRRSLAIRHSSGDEVVALIEILSPGNKNRRRALNRFLDKAISALSQGCHLLLIDPHPPGPYDPQGIHAAIWSELGDTSYEPPAGRSLTLASYSAATITRAYVEPIAVGQVLPEMPLFLEEDWYINAPLEPTYMEAYSGVPGRWRRELGAHGR